jgi:hypothetical protein
MKTIKSLHKLIEASIALSNCPKKHYTALRKVFVKNKQEPQLLMCQCKRCKESPQRMRTSAKERKAS